MTCVAQIALHSAVFLYYPRLIYNQVRPFISSDDLIRFFALVKQACMLILQDACLHICVARRCWICGAGANGVKGSVVSPQIRGVQGGKNHCVRCRHFLEGLVWWFMSLEGRHARDHLAEFRSGSLVASTNLLSRCVLPSFRSSLLLVNIS
jgi:hypothetical protein